ncbi:protein kinase domain-containing protein [Streptomyces sp. NPDC002125]
MALPAKELPVVILDGFMPTAQRLVLNRRGSTVWDIESERGRYAAKLGYPNESSEGSQPWTALAPAREGHILNALNEEPTAFGEWEEGTWNVQPWREGPSLWQLWEGCRVPGSTMEPHQSVALACAEVIAELHGKGWTHSDIQPAHLIIGPERTHLIDLALARGGRVSAGFDFPFRGCLVHYEAPEISRSVLDTGWAEPTQASDVYAFGASLLISATGARAVEYPDDAPRPMQRQAIVGGRFRDVTISGPMRSLVREMLRYDPKDRPTIYEVGKALS